jgi:glycosyltransferase involved in cell wall biosynthesis
MDISSVRKREQMKKNQFRKSSNNVIPLVSVVIPTYNGSKTIERAINSVLNQTYEKIEVIVVDDCSKDNTAEVVRSIRDDRVKLLIHEENRNGSAARNTGIREARGKYVAFLDDDDEWLEEKIEKQVKYLQSKDSKEWKAVTTSNFSKEGVANIRREGDIREDILNMRSSFAMGSSLLIEKKAIEEVGYFDEKYNRHQDQEFVLRYLRLYKLAVLNEPLLIRHPSSGIPSGEKLLEIKKIFLHDFKEDINSLGKKKASKIYARQWLQVSKHFALNGNSKLTFKYLRKSLSSGVLFSRIFKITPYEGYFTTIMALVKSVIIGRKTKDRFNQGGGFEKFNILVFAGCRDGKLNSKLAPILESDLVGSVHLSRKKSLKNSHVKLKQYYPKGVFSRILFLREISRVISGIGVILRDDVDLIVGIHFRMHSIYTYYLARIFKKNYGLLVIESPKKYEVRGLYKKVLKRASFIGVRGRNSLEYLVNSGIKREKLFIARNEFKIHSEEVKGQERIYDLIYIGNFVDVKDLPLWVEIIEEIKKEKEDVKAVMLGDGARYENIERMIEEKGLKENIQLVGRKENVYEYIDKSKLLLMTSKSEGLPMVIVEAMSRGVPSVTPNVGDITDLVQNNVNGIVIENRDSSKFAEEILRILNDKETYKKMSVQAMSSVKELASLSRLQVLVKYWEEVLKKINFDN